MCNCIRKHEGFQHRLDNDFYFGFTEGWSWQPSLLILQHHKRRRNAPQSCEMCVLWPWWVKRSLWTISIRQSSFCFTRRPGGTFRMNSVNSLLWREEEDNEEERSNWSGVVVWLTASNPERWSKTKLKKKNKKIKKKLDLSSTILARVRGSPHKNLYF